MFRFGLLLVLAVFLLCGDVEAKSKRHLAKKPVAKKPAVKPVAKLDNNKVFRQQLYNYYDTFYKAIVTVGSPAQQLEIIFDTGAQMTWFPKINCKSTGPNTEACKDPKMTYDPKKSKTAQSISSFDMTRFSTVAHGKGQYYRDRVALGDPTKGKQLEYSTVDFGAIESIREYDHGVIGLGLTSDSYGMSFMHQTMSTQAKPVFTMHMKRCDAGTCADGGQVVFGDYDTQNCEPVKETHNILPNTMHYKIDVASYEFTQANTSYHYPAGSKVVAIVDSGNSYVHLPKKTFDMLIADFDAKVNGRFHTVKCGSKIEIRLKIGNEEVVMDERSLVLNQGFGNQCVLAVNPSTSASPDAIVLGTPFFRSVCVFHNAKLRTIAFGKIKQQI